HCLPSPPSIYFTSLSKLPGRNKSSSLTHESAVVCWLRDLPKGSPIL
uniref:Ig-like domain-containing protein n=1 Tax=Ascaris lumbricoides TaxID=6252 RepID=A0A0M3HXU0_ASCLU